MIISIRKVIYILVLFPLTWLVKNNYIRTPKKISVYVILE